MSSMPPAPTSLRCAMPCGKRCTLRLPATEAAPSASAGPATTFGRTSGLRPAHPIIVRCSTSLCLKATAWPSVPSRSRRRRDGLGQTRDDSERRELRAGHSLALSFRFSGALGHLLGTLDRDVEVSDEPIPNRIDPAVHRKLLAARPCVLDKHVRGNVLDLPDDVQLDQAIPTGALIWQSLQFVPVLMMNFANGMDPVVD